MIELCKRSVRNFFEHRMIAHAEQLSYRGLFGLFPFIILVFALLAVLQLDAVFDRLIEAATNAQQQQITGPLEPVAEEGKAQMEFLRPLIEQAREQAGGGLLSFSIVISLWSVSAVASALTEALNTANGVEETRSRRKRFAFTLVFGPFLALAFIVACGLMLIGPQVAGGVAGLAGLDEAWVTLWAWLRFPAALFLLAVRGLTYGSLGTAVGMLVYLYLSALVVLLGAEINAAVYHLRQGQISENSGSAQV
jgi:membrane protein